MRTLQWLGIAAGVLVLAVGGFVLGARFADGPVGMVPGGPFESGELVAGPEPDWSFLADRPTVELQLLDPPRSRTTWIVVVDGRIFIPCGYMNSWWGRLWKQWPHHAQRDGRARLRVDGRIYPRRLVRIERGPMVEPVVDAIAEKYAPGLTPAAVESGALWIFELVPREGGQAVSSRKRGSDARPT